MAEKSLDIQFEKLQGILREMGSVVTAFSGGVDSALVAVAAHQALGGNALAVTGVSPALATRELNEAEALARQFDIAHRVIRTNEMEREGYTANSPRRCYFCKTELYTHLTALAQAEATPGSPTGPTPMTRATTDPVWRRRRSTGPAARCWRPDWTRRRYALSPGILDIPVWDKPAQPCLSSRVPYGTPVTVETLSKIERAEEFLRGLGMREVRARHHDKLCRVEASESDMEIAFRRREEIVAGLKKIGYLWVSLDLAPLRSGSLNDVLKR